MLGIQPLHLVLLAVDGGVEVLALPDVQGADMVMVKPGQPYLDTFARQRSGRVRIVTNNACAGNPCEYSVPLGSNIARCRLMNA